ncbi:hypothetical protein [Albibacterium profundi]|uniref:Tail-completion protein n=1 Tax=Albibacterium profundi TaxID=3134906 RepID=A0ABV5CEX8_9SPHI
MISIDEQTTLIYKAVNSSALKSAITGEVEKNWGPTDSDKENIVVVSITTDNSTDQRGITNVNIHVPNIVRNINEKDQELPDNKRFKELGDIAKTVLKSGFGANYNYWTESQQLLRNPNTGNWYLNFRIRFKYHN